MKTREIGYFSCRDCHKFYKAYIYDENGIGPYVQSSRPIEVTDFFLNKIYPRSKCVCQKHKLQVEEDNERLNNSR